MSTYNIEIQNVSNDASCNLAEETIRDWALAVLSQQVDSAEVTIRIVDEKESAELNQTFRNKSGPTNVLAFPFHDSEQFGFELFGDIVICSALVAKEAAEQQKTFEAHFSHLVIHGILHLLGYDHIKKEDAIRMERLEIKMLKQLGFDNPYDEVVIPQTQV